MINIKSLLIAAAASLCAVPVVAATITTDHIQPTYTGLLAAPTSNSANFRLNYQGSDLSAPAPNSRTPWEEFAAIADTAYYNSVEAGGFAEYVFTTLQTTFSLMWGSPDSYNTLRFFDAADNEVFAMSGGNSAITSATGYTPGRSFVNVSITDLDPFAKVRFGSGSDAFEYANVAPLNPPSSAAPVPLPAAVWTMGAALGALTLTSRKRRATKA